ncbi:MAG: T9SS C-terminal target domain-containing protein, partial [Ignavibacteriae bacterium]
YYVFAVPLGSYAPAYYSADSSNFHWKKASRVAVNGNNISLIDIYVHPLSVSTSGYAGVKGTVRSFGTGSAAVPGAFVYASKNNQVAGYSITNASGAFTIDGLAPGSYAITVDNLGSVEPSPSAAAVSYTSAGSPVDATIDFYLNTAATSVENSQFALPDKFELHQNYPNPFNPSTTITYAIQQPGIVVLKVYNIVGQEIQTLVNNYQAAGKYQVTLNAQLLSSGVYFYRLQSNGSTLMRKMILLR